MEDTAGEALIMSQQITSHQRVLSLDGRSTSMNLKFKHSRYVFIPNKYNYERLWPSNKMLGGQEYVALTLIELLLMDLGSQACDKDQTIGLHQSTA